MNKKVIFIIGTARSGSTLLDLILSNDKEGLSLGEVMSVFRPVHKSHFKRIAEIKRKNFVWDDIVSDRELNLYKNIFRKYENINFLVDSSKNEFWTKKQNIFCKNHNIDYKNVLIFKNPYEIADSHLKRGINWQNAYINRHRRYFTLLDDFFVISYKDLVTSRLSLKKLCNWLGLTYFKEKYNYWENKHSNFFGSKTARKKMEIKYIKPSYPNINNIVNKAINENPMIYKIYEILNNNNLKVLNTGDYKNIKYSIFELGIHYLKYIMRTYFRKIVSIK